MGHRMVLFVLIVGLFVSQNVLHAKAAPEEKPKTRENTGVKYKKYLSGSFNIDEGKIGVEEGYIARDVRERRPIGVGKEFPKGVRKLYCFTRVTGARKKVYITHVWYLNNQKAATIRLPIRSSNYRTYSSKRIPPDFEGTGRCEVYDSEGFNLATMRFKVVAK